MLDKNYINQEAFLMSIKADLQERMAAAAEPIVQEAMKAAEKKIREAVGAFVVGMIEKNVDIMRRSENLVITILNRGSSTVDRF